MLIDLSFVTSDLSRKTKKSTEVLMEADRDFLQFTQEQIKCAGKPVRRMRSSESAWLDLV